MAQSDAHRENDHQAREEDIPDIAREGKPRYDPEEARVFASGLKVMNDNRIPYVVGGAFAKHAYTGIWRDTKDLDFFLKPQDLKRAMDALSQAGFETNVEYRQWLAKARKDPYVIDLIFGTGNGQISVDDDWFENARETEIAGVKAKLIPLEELIASKSFVAERYRFDGADIVHLILCSKGHIDWQRVIARLGDNRELLLWHLLLFDFVYPSHSHHLPQDLMVQLFDEVRAHWSEREKKKAFRGTLVDPWSFIVDIEDWSYEDRRDLQPLVNKKGAAM